MTEEDARLAGGEGDRRRLASDPAARAALLRRVAAAGEQPVELAEVALVLAACDRPRVDLARYTRHLELLAQDLAAAGAGAASVAACAAALNEVMRGKHGYAGDTLTYDDLQNANLMRVIDRRKGLPVALGILYIHAARAQGWEICGLAFPGHFLVRLGGAGERAIIDPFNGAVFGGAAELRALLKTMSGADAELAPEHCAPVADRLILLRLQNNIKLRLVRNRRLEQALAVVENMLLFMPEQTALWHESALLNAHLGKYRAAVAALEEFLGREPGPAERHHAAVLLQQFKAKLN